MRRLYWLMSNAMGVPGGGGGDIRSTVGQYWLIIKKNGTNSVNFLENFIISGKLV